MTEASNVTPASRQPGDILERALRSARRAVFWERLWPALATLATVIGIFLAASWLGLWLWLPPVGRAIVLGGFAVLTLAAAVPLLWVRFPSRLDGLRRLDRNTALPHRPATAISDELATPRSDPWSAALWRAHVERALSVARNLKAGRPSPRLDVRDPTAVRALVLMLVVATFIAAGGERGRRIAAAFDWHGVMVPANFRLDAWVSPPTYTAKPPVILPGMHPGEPAQTSVAAVAVPAGSVLVIRASGKVRFDVATTGGVAEVAGDQRPQAPSGTEERRYQITDRGTAVVHGLGDEDLTYAFNAIPDKPPAIALTKDPETQPGGSLQLNYKMEDDYGVVEAKALFALKGAGEATKDGHTAHPLFDAPEVQLMLPQARVKNGTGQTTKDLSDHPWAGAEVTMTLKARDEGNNEGTSEPHGMRLPERQFVKQLARAIIEQRRDLATDAENRDQVLIALDALAMAPDKFMPELGHYLGLRSLFWQLSQAKNDDDLREVVKQMWAYAVMLEDGNMADAAARLKNAEEALRNALERGASDEELKRLMEELRAAMDQFLQALAEELRKNPQMARPLDPNSQQLRGQDLKSMLDRMEQLAKSGQRDAAKQLLDQLSQMMQNLQMARPNQNGQDGDDDMMSMLDELGDMIRKEQQLRDKTFRQGQDQQRDQRDQQRGQQRGQRGQRGQQGQQGQQQQGQNGDPNAFSDLRQNQQALREQLKKLLEEMKKRGLGQNQQGQDGQQGQQGDQQGQQQGQSGERGQQKGPGQQPGLDGDDLADADDAMGQAEGALGEGNSDRAVDRMGRAIDAMRKGAQNLAQQLQQQMGPQQGQNGQPGRLGPPSRAQQETDPLGRPLRGRDYGDDTTVKVPGEIDAQRARRILEELRRRFGEAFRPQLELEYIERLLKDY
jgi:uncharacterized protein (TIGR02302 family)